MTNPTCTVTARTCQCEHIDHVDGDAYVSCHSPAGEHRAIYVGPICNSCATEHLAGHHEDEHGGCIGCINELLTTNPWDIATL